MNARDDAACRLTAARFGLRKITTIDEEWRAEAGTEVTAPLRQVAVAATIRNPWIGGGTDEDLSREVEALAPALAGLIANRLLAAAGGEAAVVAFGKAALVGTRGEVEHGAALIHTPYFGNLIREYLDGTSVLCFADARGPAGESIKVPLWHKTQAGLRDYYQSMDVRVADAPGPDEICVVAGVATGPRPFARIGDRTTDPEVTSTTVEGNKS